MGVAVEGQHHVDHVLEALWPGNSPVLCHMSDQKHNYAARLGRGNQPSSSVPHQRRCPRNTTCCVGNRLDRVDHNDGPCTGVDHGCKPINVRFGDHRQAIRNGVDASCSQPNLILGFLTGGDEDARPQAGERRTDLEYERGLSDAGFTSQERHRAGHQSAAKNAVELLGPGRQASKRRTDNFAYRSRQRI